jgi:DNA repair protein RecN (Recombination protein N)
MLLSLTIKNYALINELHIQFDQGFNVITGETGAGKSIILGALGLILGQRADTSVLNNPEKKCVIEGRFECKKSNDLEQFFVHNDLDWEIPLVLRREIAPGGKTRAFVNDTPVQLSLLRDVALQLIDIHSQHANLELGKRSFQLKVIDWFGGFGTMLDAYGSDYMKLTAMQKEYEELKAKEAREKTDYDYHIFQYKQLADAQLREEEQQELEAEHQALIHSEEIKESLGMVNALLDDGEPSALTRIKEASTILSRVKPFFSEANQLKQRVESALYDLRDLADECNRMAELSEHDPQRLEQVASRLDMLYTLQQKHRVSDISGLIAIRDRLEMKIQEVNSYEGQIAEKEKQIQETTKVVSQKAEELHQARCSVIVQLTEDILGYLKNLGMPNATFIIDIQKKTNLSPTGIDEAVFLFSANKGFKAEEISKVASGGEMSRLMLAIKTVVAQSKALPAIVFDEIDTGISGEIAVMMGSILLQMSRHMQVINITHLPQIAARGDAHFLVFKTDNEFGTETGMKRLGDEERITEIAKMLGGNNPSGSATDHAKVLLKS